MNDQKLISVIVPVYNVEEYLEECVNSILNQTYSNLEIILVNDGSTDNCIDICNKYKDIDKRVIVINKDNGGLSDARNVGLKKATGAYIAFVDSDDFIEQDMYELLYNEIHLNNADISGCDYYIYNKNTIAKSDTITQEKCIMDSSEAIIKMNQLTGFGISACNKIYKRELFDGIEFPYKKLNEDWFVMYKLIDRANKIIYNPKAKYYYRQRVASITKNSKINFTPIEATQEVLNFVMEKYPNAIQSCEYAYVNANIGIYNKLLEKNICRKERKKYICNIKKYEKNVLKFEYIKIYKRFQIIAVAHFSILYDFIIKFKLKLKKRTLIKYRK